MTTIIIVFAIASIISMITSMVLIPISRKYHLTDEPDNIRKLQTSAIPKTGGVAIFAGFTLPLILLIYFQDRTLVAHSILPLSGDLLNLVYVSLLVLAIGIIDDIRDVRARWKILGEIIVGIAAYLIGFRIEIINLPLIGTIELGIIAPILTVFWFVACMNSVNLLDGMDGLAGGACLFATISLLAMSLINDNTTGMLLMSCLAGATSGFLVLNFPPAKIYLGNSGSLLLGFLIAALSLVGAHHKAETAVSLMVPIIALGLPIIDTGLAILRRWYHRVPISGADREHIHHILTSMGYSPRTAILLLYGICVGFGIIALLLLVPRSEIAALILIFLILIIYASVRIFTGMTFEKLVARLGEDSTRNTKTKIIKLTAQRSITGIKNTQSLEDAWSHFCQLLNVIGFSSAKLTLTTSATIDHISYTWKTDKTPDTSNSSYTLLDHSVTYLAIRLDDCAIGSIELYTDASLISQIWLTETADMIDQARLALTGKIITLQDGK